MAPIDVQASVGENRADDLSRDVYCILGLPIDAITMTAVLKRIEVAASNVAPFVLSTPNLNFLVSSQIDSDFRESLLMSDLSTVDGISIVWVARLLGIPLRERIAGSDIFETLKSAYRSLRPLRVFLFGGAEGVASAAATALNAEGSGLRCVGWVYPGFGTVEQMSQDDFIDAINSSDAGFLVASLSAKKGQVWLHKNHHRLRVPVRAHLGATINFQAGTVRRAPALVRRLGLEWLWRIKEEPCLWKRYWHDCGMLLRLLLASLLPLAIHAWCERFRRENEHLITTQSHGGLYTTVKLHGCATARNVEKAAASFREAMRFKRGLVIDLSQTRRIDARFLGLLLMLRKHVKGQGLTLTCAGASSGLRRLFRLNRVDFLLNSDASV